MTNHNCIKCKASYQDNDPDDYYCPPCNVERKVIAAEIDKKMGTLPRRAAPSVFKESDFVGDRGRIMFDANGMRI